MTAFSVVITQHGRCMPSETQFQLLSKRSSARSQQFLHPHRVLSIEHCGFPLPAVSKIIFVVGVVLYCGWQAAKAKRKEKDVVPKEDQKAKKARIDVKKDTVGNVCCMTYCADCVKKSQASVSSVNDSPALETAALNGRSRVCMLYLLCNRIGYKYRASSRYPQFW